jgi:hypothetical protein
MPSIELIGIECESLPTQYTRRASRDATESRSRQDRSQQANAQAPRINEQRTNAAPPASQALAWQATAEGQSVPAQGAAAQSPSRGSSTSDALNGDHHPSASSLVSSAVEAHDSMLAFLSTHQTTTLQQITVKDVEEFGDAKAEAKYLKFIDFLCEASNDWSTPEDDPLVHFRGRFIGFDQVVLVPREPNAKPLPYVRFVGAEDENEVRILHASLSKKKFRCQYFPPLSLCYTMRRLRALASSDSGATLLQRRQYTLCGALVSIQSDGDSRTVTIGGMLRGPDGYFALTAGHGGDGSLSRRAPLSQPPLNPMDYDDDVAGPLIDDSNQSAEENVSPESLSSESYDSPEMMKAANAFGSVKATGDDWTLLEVHNPVHRLPNILGLDGQTPSNPILLDKIALSPRVGSMTLVAGGKRILSVSMLRKPANLRYPSGSWLRTWKVKLSGSSGTDEFSTVPRYT